MDDWHGKLQRRCAATNRDGQRCGRAPIVGGSVCVMHGGSARHTLAAAERRLLAGVEPAVAWLVDFIEAPKGHCEVCKRNDNPAAYIAACKAVLDRVPGFGPAVKLEVSRPADDFGGATTDEMIDRCETLLRRLREMQAAEHRYLEGDLLDGDIHDLGQRIPVGTGPETPSEDESNQ